MPEDPKKSNPETSENKMEPETEKSIKDGAKIIDIEKKVGGKSEQESNEDAEKFRNEG